MLQKKFVLLWGPTFCGGPCSAEHAEQWPLASTSALSSQWLLSEIWACASTPSCQCGRMSRVWYTRASVICAEYMPSVDSSATTSQQGSLQHFSCCVWTTVDVELDSCYGWLVFQLTHWHCLRVLNATAWLFWILSHTTMWPQLSKCCTGYQLQRGSVQVMPGDPRVASWTHAGARLRLTDISCRCTCSICTACFVVWRPRRTTDTSTNQRQGFLCRRTVSMEQAADTAEAMALCLSTCIFVCPSQSVFY